MSQKVILRSIILNGINDRREREMVLVWKKSEMEVVHRVGGIYRRQVQILIWQAGGRE